MPLEAHYSPSFFARIQDGSLESARQAAPVIWELVRPASVVDVGCGTGAWLAAFRELGVGDVLGLDGDYVDRDALLIPPEKFQAADLAEPLALERRFDLVVSLEVGEHLPASSAGTYVHSLTRLGDVIAFSAAIPNQTGKGHINEQWPDYWRDLFAEEGYALVDALRPRLWENRDIERWYRQNMFLYVERRHLAADARLLRALQAGSGLPLSAVHPATFLSPSVSAVLKMLPVALRSALRRRGIGMGGRLRMPSRVGPAAQDRPVDQRR